MRVSSFAEIEGEFIARANDMVYAALATVAPKGPPRTRVVHLVWEGATGWMTGFPGTPKAADIAQNPYVSLARPCPVLVEAERWLRSPPHGDTRGAAGG